MSNSAPTAAPAATPRPGASRNFPCPGCGAAMAFDPGRCALACASCGHARLLPPPTTDAQAQALQEQDYHEALRRLAAREPSLEARVVDCPACGAQTQFDGHVVGDLCAFCASPLLVEQAHVERLIRAQALVPFALDRQAAQQVFSRWVASRWFAPNALKHTVSQADGIRGVYVPWWTYDASTVTTYRGERGVQRQVVDHRPGASASAGPARRVVTDWTPTAGAVQVAFDDILVVGSPSIPAHLARVLGDWNLAALRPPEPDLLAGFSVEVYRHGLEQGFSEARGRMEGAIDAAIRRDIGGHQQRIHGRQTVVDDIRFKHLLLPVWIGSYRFGGKPYQVVVNGQTGEVEGDRPYSTIKVALAVILALVLVLVFASLSSG